MEDYYFLENFGTQLRTFWEIFGTSSDLFGSFITKSWLSRVKVKAGKYNNGRSVAPPLLFSFTLPFSFAAYRNHTLCYGSPRTSLVSIGPRRKTDNHLQK